MLPESDAIGNEETVDESEFSFSILDLTYILRNTVEETSNILLSELTSLVQELKSDLAGQFVDLHSRVDLLENNLKSRMKKLDVIKVTNNMSDFRILMECIM